MKKASLLFLMFLGFSYYSMGQDSKPVTLNPADPTFREKFSHLDFDGEFYLLALKDAVNNYYMADFSRLAEKFERVYFLELVYKSEKIVNIDSDISQDRVWFKVANNYTEKEAGTLFDQLLDKTLKAAATLTVDEKSAWMMKNDKYK